MSSPQGLSPGWYAALTLLALYGSWFATEFFALSLEPAIFLPFLVAWLACQFRCSLTTLWLWLGVLAAFGVDLVLTDRLSIGLGFSTLYVLLAVAATYTFSRPAAFASLSSLFNRRWSWLKWLVPVAMWPAIYVSPWPEFQLGDTLELGFKPGMAMLALVLLAGVDRRVLVSKVEPEICSSNRPWATRLRLALLAILTILVILDVQWDVAYVLRFQLGFAGGMQLVYAVVAVLAVLRVVDWRLLIVGLLAYLALEWPLFWLGDAIGSLLENLRQNDVDAPAPGVAGLEQIVVTGSPRFLISRFREGAIYGISAILMATAFAAFVESRRIETLFERRTAIFVLASLVVAIVGGTLFLYGLHTFGILLVGTAAYLCGLTWRVRGLLLSPVVLQFAYLASLPLLPDQDELLDHAFDSVRIGLYAFAFAYFGFLSNRLLAGPQEQARTARAPEVSA